MEYKTLLLQQLDELKKMSVKLWNHLENGDELSDDEFNLLFLKYEEVLDQMLEIDFYLNN